MAEFTMKKARQTDVVDKIGKEFRNYMEDYSTSSISFPKKGPTKKQASKSMEEQKKIYTLTVECVSGRYFEEDCVRVIEIEEKASLHDLHLAIRARLTMTTYSGWHRYSSVSCDSLFTDIQIGLKIGITALTSLEIRYKRINMIIGQGCATRF